MDATPRLWQGHLKVTARSNHLKMGENSYFVNFPHLTSDVYDSDYEAQPKQVYT